MKIILTFLIIFFTNVYAKDKNILILNSYHKGFEVSDIIIENIQKVLYSKDNININILYMDSKEIRSRDYIKELSDLYSIQLKNRSYDLIITIDKFAYLFALKNYHILFHNEVILFAGLEQYSKELVQIYGMEDKINGILEKFFIKDNIDLIRKTMPDLKKLYIINDRSLNADDTSPFITKAIMKLKNEIKVEYLRDDTLQELVDYFSIYRKDEAIFFLRFTNDRNGKFYNNKEVESAIRAFQLPIFVSDSLFINKGVVGGKILSFDNIGLKVGYKALRILKRKQIGADVVLNTEFEYIFDQKKLSEYDLSIPSEIRDFKLINSAIGFFDKYRSLINSIFLISPILIVVIFGLLNALNEKQVSSRKLKQRVEFDKVLLNAIDSPIFWQNKEGIILDANAKFCELVGVPYNILKSNTLDNLSFDYIKAKKINAYIKTYVKDEKKDKQIYLKNIYGNKKIYSLSQTSYESSSYVSGIVTVFTDITKDKRIEEERIKHTQYMIQQSKLAEIGEVFSSIAHQWKSPLVEITALAQDMFYSHDTNEKEEDSYHINNIMIQAKYMTDTINDFQDFIMPSKEKTYFNAYDTIKSMLNIVKHNMKYNYININLDI
ncbi:MAG: PAS domain S-box protein, partial [Campylobacteraceae bacterium]|nr:PAS domain S-box protein [Campylobacteraceae bacterium]